MSVLDVVNQKLTQVINWMNSVDSNSKTTEELPVMSALIPEALVRVSIEGTSKSLILQKIIDAARTGINGLSPWAAGTYPVQTAVIKNDKIYLLSSGVSSLPFESVDFNTELEAGNWILPNIPTTVELVESPNTPVFDLGDITDLITDNDFVAYINTNGDQYDLTDTTKTYFFRFINNNIDYLYAYNSVAGGFLTYGDGSGNTMLIDYLNLFFNTALSSDAGYQNLQSVTTGPGNNETTNPIKVKISATRYAIVTGDGVEVANDEAGSTTSLAPDSIELSSADGFGIITPISIQVQNQILDQEGLKLQQGDCQSTIGNSGVTSNGITYELPNAPSGSRQLALRSDVDNAIAALLDGVDTQGDTFQKLYNLVLGASVEVTVADIPERDAYDVPGLSFHIFVVDDGDGDWALYKAISTGVGATFVKLSDPDLLNAVMSASAIKTAYESNSDTNALTNTLLSKLNGIAAGATANDSDANLKNRANHTGSQLASTILDFSSAVSDLLPDNYVFLAADETNSTTTDADVPGFSFTIPPGKVAECDFIFGFATGATTTGLGLTIQVAQPVSADGSVIGSWSTSIEMNSAGLTTGSCSISGGTVNVAANTTTDYSMLTAQRATGQGGAMGKTILKNTSTNVTATVKIRFRSEVAASAATISAGSAMSVKTR